MEVAYIFIVEPGYLETQAVLLARSIRRWGGSLLHGEIHAFSPRPDTSIPAETAAALDHEDVVLIEDPLNVDHAYYPFCNKIYACAEAERSIDADVLVFLDTDTVIVNEPSAFLLPDGVDLAVQPVVRKGQGSTGPGDPNDPYWLKTYELCGVPEAPFVETMRNRRRIRGYFNAGLIVTRRSAGSFQRWFDCFRRLIDAGHILDDKITNLDQHALAAAAVAAGDRVQLLDWRYNYAIPQRARFSGPMQTADLDELVHLHYHRWFNVPDFLRKLDPPLEPGTPQFQWLERHLPFEPVIDEPLHGAVQDRTALREVREQARSQWRGG